MDAETFQAGIEFLKDNDPSNKWIEDFENKGFSLMNWKIMQKQLDITDVGHGNEVKSHTINANDLNVKSVKIDDSILNDLYRQKNILFAKRAKQSNKFHQVKTNKGRASISDMINSIQNQIYQKMLDIDNYYKTGVVPKNYNNDYPIPKSSLEKYLLYKRLGVRISNKKSHIRNIIAADNIDDMTRSTRLKKANSKLSYLNTYKKHVESSIGR